MPHSKGVRQIDEVSGKPLEIFVLCLILHGPMIYKRAGYAVYMHAHLHVGEQ